VDFGNTELKTGIDIESGAHESGCRVHVSRSGSQYVNMGLNFMQLNHNFKNNRSLLGSAHVSPFFDLREVLYPRNGNVEEAAQKLEQTFITQSALLQSNMPSQNCGCPGV
jgi:hypothetical protein